MSSISDDIRMRWATGGMVVRLLLVNVAVYLLLATLGLLETMGIPVPNPGGAFGLATTSDLHLLIRRPWSIVTHMFVHLGVWHLVMNLLILWWMGGMFRSYFGDRRTLSTYLMGGLSGWLAYFVLLNTVPGFGGGGGFALGASAAVMALMVATAVYLPDTTIRLFLIGPVKLKWVALVYVLLDYAALSRGANVGGHIGHLGGAAYGLLYVRGMKSGRDLGAPLERLLDALTTLFSRGTAGTSRAKKSRTKRKRGKGLYAVHRSVDKEGRTQRARTDEEFNAEKKARQERIDRILDKISKVGYDQLTKEEKDFLFRFGGDV
jgi:membrane associated rhomboid family serine protease